MVSGDKMDMDTTSSSRVDENDIFADADADADVDTDTEGPAPAKGAAATKSSAASDGAPASAAAATAGTSDDAKDTQHDGDGDEEEETIDSIESRKLKLLQDLQDHPERFWSSSTSSSSTTNAASASAAASSTTMNENDDKHDEDDESHENPTKRLKIGNTKDSEQIVDKGISPSVMDEEFVKKIRTMVYSCFDKGGNSSSCNDSDDGGDTTMASATLTTTTEGEGKPRGGDETTDNEENRSSTLNDESALQLLDRVRKELERMASTGRSNCHHGQFDGGNSIEPPHEGTDQSKAPVEDGNPSLPKQPSSSSSSSSSSSTNVATNVLGWLCLDLKRVVQKATIESDNRNHHLTQNESGKIDARDMTAFAAPSRKPPAAAATNDTDISQDEYATLLCDERLPSSIGGGNDAIETSENNNKPSSSNDDIIQDEDGVSLLMCQENGLFAGDNNNKPSGSASSSTGKPTVTTSVKVGSDVASNVHQQTLAIIRETTRLLRTKTINLTKRRVEGTRNIQQKQTSSSTTTTIDTR
mmetsp:Transcript_1891/g.4376  ORF Transcript_1891/g.4376 Transcript_1891/m.4376 type:complete len:529 (+) Transcript_1891:82-1668(+)